MYRELNRQNKRDPFRLKNKQTTLIFNNHMQGFKHVHIRIVCSIIIFMRFPFYFLFCFFLFCLSILPYACYTIYQEI